MRFRACRARARHTCDRLRMRVATAFACAAAQPTVLEVALAAQRAGRAAVRNERARALRPHRVGPLGSAAEQLVRCMNDGRHRPVWQDDNDNDDDGDAPAPQMAQLARTASVELGIGRTSSATTRRGPHLHGKSAPRPRRAAPAAHTRIAEQRTVLRLLRRLPASLDGVRRYFCRTLRATS
jgi:hypothetical protein